MKFQIVCFMLLACHKKSHVFDKISKLEISKYYVMLVLIFFFNVQTKTTKRTETAA